MSQREGLVATLACEEVVHAERSLLIPRPAGSAEDDRRLRAGKPYFDLITPPLSWGLVTFESSFGVAFDQKVDQGVENVARGDDEGGYQAFTLGHLEKG